MDRNVLLKVASKSSRLKNMSELRGDIIEVEALIGGGFILHKTYKDGGESGGNFYGLVTYDNLKNLDGKILTLIDATFNDREQRKAMKDVFRRMFWFDWVEHHIEQGHNPSMPTGMPIEE